MRRLLPPLHALRAFEAAGRHLSFSRAADELCVSVAAVSRQIRALEAFLGQPLFERLTRQVRFTAFGAGYFDQVGAGFSTIEDATRSALRSQRRPVVVDAMPTTANLCLMPWMSSFTEDSRIDVQVVSSMAPVDFAAGRTDVAIRVGTLPGRESDAATGTIPHRMAVDWTGVTAQHLWDEILVPICSRAYLDAHLGARAPDAWDGRELIHVVSRARAWDDWFRAQGRAGAPSAPGLAVGHFYVALQMARRHRGIALVPTVHFHALEWRDEMACPCAGALRSDGGFYLLYRTGADRQERVATFLQWIRRQGDQALPVPAR
jgi:LysR family glycine cleavage system transcriptional activator